MKNKYILIFEGPDRTGKTEIATTLGKFLNLDTFKNKKEHEVVEKGDNLNGLLYETSYLLQLLKQIKFGSNGIILDRHFPSEYVYAKVLKRETNEDFIWKMDEEFAKLNAVIIYCYKSSYDNYNDTHIKKDKIPLIRDVYENDYLKKTKMNIIKLDTKSENLQEQIQYILQELTKLYI